MQANPARMITVSTALAITANTVPITNKMNATKNKMSASLAFP